MIDESRGPWKVREPLGAGGFLLRIRGLSLGAACLLLCVACAGGELEFADWMPPVDEGTPVFEYVGVSIEERQGKEVGAIEDLVLGADFTRTQEVFYQISGVVPDPSGNIYVLERGNNRVQVFDPEGTYVRTMGRQGEGEREASRSTSRAVGQAPGDHGPAPPAPRRSPATRCPLRWPRPLRPGPGVA